MRSSFKKSAALLLLAVLLVHAAHCCAIYRDDGFDLAFEQSSGAPIPYSGIFLPATLSALSPSSEDDLESILENALLVWFIFGLFVFGISVFHRYHYTYLRYRKRPPILALPIGGNSPPSSAACLT